MSCLTRVASIRHEVTITDHYAAFGIVEAFVGKPVVAAAHEGKFSTRRSRSRSRSRQKDELIQAKDDTILELRLALKDLEVGDRELSRPTDPARIRWAVPLARIYGVLPLPCPSCGGPMKILAFLTDPSVVSNILLHLDLHHLPSPLSPADGVPLTVEGGGSGESPC